MNFALKGFTDREDCMRVVDLANKYTKEEATTPQTYTVNNDREYKVVYWGERDIMMIERVK